MTKEWKPRTLAEAQMEVEAVLLAESQRRGESWIEANVDLFYGGDVDKMIADGNPLIGIRVTSLGFFGRKPPDFSEGNLAGYCGCSGADMDSLESLAACAAAERAIMARVCYFESDDENQLYEIERADAMLIEANWPDEPAASGTHVVAVGNAFDGTTLHGPFPSSEDAVSFGEGTKEKDWHVIQLGETAMSFKTKLALAVLASEKITFEPRLCGVMYPVTKAEHTKGHINLQTDWGIIVADSEQEITVDSIGGAKFKDFDGVEHGAEFEARGSLVPLREEHIAAVSP
jgi:hypothetical protein